MQGIDPVVKKETARIAVGTLILSAVMELIFVLFNKWDLTVLWGNLLGTFTAVLNFFLMCLTVVKCVSLPPDKAALKIRASQGGRLIMMAAACIAGALLPCFNLIAVVVPLLFPRIVIMFWQLTHRGESLTLPAPAQNGGTVPETPIEDTEDTEN